MQHRQHKEERPVTVETPCVEYVFHRVKAESGTRTCARHLIVLSVTDACFWGHRREVGQ